MAKLIVPLMGGLGNQLFQLQAALSLFDGEIELLGNIGKPRLTSGIPDICYSKLPERVIYRRRREVKFLEKVHSLVLRNSLYGAHQGARKRIINMFAAIIFSLYMKRIVRVRTSNNLGFCEMGRIAGNTFLIGYFQSYRWTNQEISQVVITGCSEKIQHLKNESSLKSICILHIRLTDYLSEENFGQLTSDYYEEALDLIYANLKIEEIWLFSDDINLALTIIPIKYRDKIRVIDDTGLLPIEVLVGMACGDAYVIANSTFSWWAARLSSARMIIAPKPWFRSAESPKELIPVEWIQLERS